MFGRVLNTILPNADSFSFTGKKINSKLDFFCNDRLEIFEVNPIDIRHRLHHRRYKC